MPVHYLRERSYSAVGLHTTVYVAYLVVHTHKKRKPEEGFLSYNKADQPGHYRVRGYSAVSLL